MEDEILRGLKAKQKYIPTKYFYDDAGSRIFQEIMNMPEYYLTDCEFEILSQQSAKILEAVPFKGEEFQIVELGAGDGLKTMALLKGFLAKGAKFTYEPIDISEEALRSLEIRMKKEIPDLNISPACGDYFEKLKEFTKGKKPILVLFLGSNIGNYSKNGGKELLQKIRRVLHDRDAVLVGFDLQKNPLIIQEAYADPHGVTKRFNLNLLTRINRELGGNFEMDKFDFYVYYEPEKGVVLSHLVSVKKQNVHLRKLDETVQFSAGELIFTEYSRKFTLGQIEKWSEKSGFSQTISFLDCKHFFCDALLLA